MMTTMAALLGALPLAIGFGDGGELRQPLGIAIVGGLIVSQVLTLYTTPVDLPLSRPLPPVGAAPLAQQTPGRRARARRAANEAAASRSPPRSPRAGRLHRRPGLSAAAGATPPAYKEIDGWKPATPRRCRKAARRGGRSMTTRCSTGSSARSTSRTRPSRPPRPPSARRAPWSTRRAPPISRPSPIGASAARSATSLQGVSRTRGGGSGGRQLDELPEFLRDRAGASWEPDIWGRIRRTVESDVANAQAERRRSRRGAALGAGDARHRLFRAARRRRAEARARRRRSPPISARSRSRRTSTSAGVAAADRRGHRRDAARERRRRRRINVGVQRAAARARHRGADRQAAGRVLDRAA